MRDSERGDGSRVPALKITPDYRVLRGRLRDARDSRHILEVSILRSPAWLAAYYDPTARKAWLDWGDELGVAGVLEVESVEPPTRALEQSRTTKQNGSTVSTERLVTGTVCHLNADVYELRLRESGEVLRTTGRHPFWSMDRRAWIRAHLLRRGERLGAGPDGDDVVTVESVDRLPGEWRVYNLEVQGTHTYHVGASLLLTHNAVSGK